MDTCNACRHRAHNGTCGYPITETVRDDEGWIAPPSGEVWEEIVKLCRCGDPTLVLDDEETPPSRQ